MLCLRMGYKLALLLPLLLSVVHGAYNVTAAKNYSYDYAYFYNSAYCNFRSDSDCDWWGTSEQNTWCKGDCSNFVSQCLKAGGLTLTGPTACYQNLVIPSADNLATWIKTTHLSNNSSKWLDGSFNAMPSFTVEPGDVIQLGTSGDEYVHSLFVYRVTSQSYSGIYVCAHNTDRRDYALSNYYAFSRIHFYNMYSAGGINDLVAIVNPPSYCDLFDNTTFTATFTDADMSGSYTDVWDWELVAYHSTGTYTLASATGLVGHNQITWNTQLAGLPQGYQWSRDGDGVMAHVLVRTTDSDGYLHEKQVGLKVRCFSATGQLSGTNIGKANNFDVNGGDGADMAYLLHLETTRNLNITTCNSQTNFDTKLEVFRTNGTSTGFYNDDDNSCGYGIRNSTLQNIQLPAGDYYVVVDGYNGEQGNFALDVEFVQTPTPVPATTLPVLLSMIGILGFAGSYAARVRGKGRS